MRCAPDVPAGGRSSRSRAVDHPDHHRGERGNRERDHPQDPRVQLDLPHQDLGRDGAVGLGDLRKARTSSSSFPKDFRCQRRTRHGLSNTTRRLRVERRLNDFYVKVLFVDDDGVPTKSYIEKVFRADYDVCEGIPTPRTGYGRFLSHMDDLRTINCLYMCSVFQGLGHPIHVHGEGLCVRGTAEALVTWDYEMFASEDLVFGHMAVYQEDDLGVRVGLRGDHVPFTWRDFLNQRRRWLWGNIHAIRHVLPLTIEHPADRPVLPTGSSRSSFPPSGSCSRFTGALHLGPASCRGWWCRWRSGSRCSRLSGAINSGGGASRGIRRVRDVVVAVLLAFVTSAVAIGVQVVALFKGNPHRFEVIQKTDPKAKKPSLATIQARVRRRSLSCAYPIRSPPDRRTRRQTGRGTWAP